MRHKINLNAACSHEHILSEFVKCFLSCCGHEDYSVEIKTLVSGHTPSANFKMDCLSEAKKILIRGFKKLIV